MMFYIFVKINDELTNAIFLNILFSFFKKFGLHVTHSIIILLPYFFKTLILPSYNHLIGFVPLYVYFL